MWYIKFQNATPLLWYWVIDPLSSWIPSFHECSAKSDIGSIHSDTAPYKYAWWYLKIRATAMQLEYTWWHDTWWYHHKYMFAVRLVWLGVPTVPTTQLCPSPDPAFLVGTRAKLWDGIDKVCRNIGNTHRFVSFYHNTWAWVAPIFTGVWGISLQRGQTRAQVCLARWVLAYTTQCVCMHPHT